MIEWDSRIGVGYVGGCACGQPGRKGGEAASRDVFLITILPNCRAGAGWRMVATRDGHAYPTRNVRDNPTHNLAPTGLAAVAQQDSTQSNQRPCFSPQYRQRHR
jgi:hypothetical protein